MSTARNSQEFHESLPRGPLTQHIAQIYSVLLYRNRDADPSAFQIAERSLREIAAYTAEPPERRYAGRYAPLTSGLDALREAARRMTEQLSRRGSVDPERTAVRLYKSRIEGERAKGLAHVRAEALRVRKELGLDQ